MGGELRPHCSPRVARTMRICRESTFRLKLSVVNPELAGELIPQISRYANSQNKVSDADFFANHPFHRRMEEIFRYLGNPAAGVIPDQMVLWRARGQYRTSS